jgi:hypothetical protein
MYEEKYDFKTSQTSSNNDLHLSLDGSPNSSNPMISVRDQEPEVPHTALDDKKRRRRQMAGAAAVGGVAGLVLVGPLVALAAAGGAAALVASKRNGPVANSTRATGEVVANVGGSIKQFEDKHQFAHKTASSVSQGCNWVSTKFNRK